MTISYITQDTKAPQVRNSIEYPSGCSPNYWDIVEKSDVHFYHNAKYEVEHRPYPSDLFSALTSRPLVYNRNGTSPRNNVISLESYPCPHDGVHGMVVATSYHVGRSPIVFSPGLTSLESQRLWIGKLRDKLSVQKVNLGSSLAEYRDSTKMLAKAAHGLHSAYQVLRGRYPRRKLRACSIPASVLQYNFGVAPLVNDLYSSVETLRHRLEKPLIKKLSVGIKIGRENPFTTGPHDYFDVKSLYKERAKITYKLNPSHYLSQDFDFGNPIEWAWELIPFSFVVDWAIPIGEWLGRIDALQGVEDIHGTVTIRTDEQWKYMASATIRCDELGTYHGTTYKRDVIDTIPQPPFPKWSPSLSWRRATSAVSLLWGMSKPCRSGK